MRKPPAAARRQGPMAMARAGKLIEVTDRLSFLCIQIVTATSHCATRCGAWRRETEFRGVSAPATGHHGTAGFAARNRQPFDVQHNIVVERIRERRWSSRGKSPPAFTAHVSSSCLTAAACPPSSNRRPSPRRSTSGCGRNAPVSKRATPQRRLAVPISPASRT